MTSFHAYAALNSTLLICLALLLTAAHCMKDNGEVASNRKRLLLIILKCCNVGLTVVCFIQLFNSDLHFDIADDLDDYLGISGDGDVEVDVEVEDADAGAEAAEEATEATESG